MLDAVTAIQASEACASVGPRCAWLNPKGFRVV
jgi:hypothetical protein